MKKNKYKILILADLKKSTSSTLQSTVSLAKMIDAEVDFFYVKSASDVVERENQLSAMRAINHDYTATDKKIKKIVKTIADEHQININYSFVFGNVKHEIASYIEQKQPDIIVLGKKKNNLISLGGDKIIQFVLKQFDGTILIADANNTLEPNEKLSLGVLNSIEPLFNSSLAEDLFAHMQEPIKSFKIVEKSKTSEETNLSANSNTIEYVFEENDNTISNLSNYLTKNNINLLCVNRHEDPSKSKSKTATQNMKLIVNNLHVSLLLTGKRNYSL
ncbi:nucleotide-binding universal stress UspA family protein [Mariniflexile fucanivorans]|uniref:Nucleotide-binding universal stress UspA family protein n=1 Tax=Mariniflexile fucanivorans TaxID=264023 RepID=A0A4R1RCM3_9FLAO|nr:universal stress protein [Mariniflexile fucanivorans]TCL63519.1 nucleotide-binding universal stress UspA family protein [Mariniflexile fucanivorans]